MIRTWSLESALIRAQSALAVAVQGVWDGLVVLERVTRPPRLGHDVDAPIPGCPNASDCRDYGCAGDCSEAVESPAYTEEPLAEWEQELRDAYEAPNPTEPSLSDDELVAVRGLIQERYETSADVPRNGSAEHPAGVDTSFPTSVPPAGPQLDWHGWAEPAVLEVLSEHRYAFGYDTNCECGQPGIWDFTDWIEHVAPEVVARIGCDPARAIAALHNHTPQK